MINLRSSSTFFRQSSFTTTSLKADDTTVCHPSSSDNTSAITSETTSTSAAARAHQTTVKTIAMLTKRIRRVRFSTVEFKVYPVTLSGCTVPNHGGPPIGIDYSVPPIELVKCKIEEYEMGKIIFVKSSSLSCIADTEYDRRGGSGGRTHLFQLSAYERCDLLLNQGITLQRISCYTVNCHKLRDERRKSYQSYNHWNILKINFFAAMKKKGSDAFRSRV